VLKVLHAPFTFAPDPVGGTEVYVEALAQLLLVCGIQSIVAAPSAHGVDEIYEHNGLRVRRYRSASESAHMLRELYGAGDPIAASAFARILDEEMPDIVHLHAFTRAVSILLVRAAKERGIPTFFTYHTPTASCQRGTLILQGKEICDGALDVRRCTDCSLANEGLSRWISRPLSYVPSLFAKMLEEANLSGGVWTALRMADLIRGRSNAFHKLVSEVDGIVSLREWVRALLIRNGVPESKITHSPHGLAGAGRRSGPLADLEGTPLRVAFLGRADKVKGIDTLIKAVRGAPKLGVELDLYGITQSLGDQAYRMALENLAAQDTRIRFLPPVPHEKVVSLLASYHLLAVPSRWMETGPFVVLEAFAAGTPVLGSNLGGIAEWVTHEKNGLLIHFEDVPGWTDAIRRCAEDRLLLRKLREGVKQPRSMTDVARDMAQMYRGHLDSSEQCTRALSAK
jgi:glycosyltransferase involved in cell wall biosynthesis